MTTSTDLAMCLAQAKLDLRKLASKHTGNHRGFDQYLQRAINAINGMIVTSIQAVRDPNVPRGSHRRQKEIPESAAQRHANWIEKQYQPVHHLVKRRAPMLVGERIKTNGQQ